MQNQMGPLEVVDIRTIQRSLETNFYSADFTNKKINIQYYIIYNNQLFYII